MKQSVQAVVLWTMGTVLAGCASGYVEREVNPFTGEDTPERMVDGGDTDDGGVDDSERGAGPVGPTEPGDVVVGVTAEPPGVPPSEGGTSAGTPGGSGGAPGAGAGTSFACPAAQSSGVVHYVCDCGPGAAAGCVPGNDGNTGDSAQSPWRSYEKARSAFGSMAAGETIALCRGGAFSIGASSRWVNNRCRADKRCIVRDYAPSWADATTGAPIITTNGDQAIFSLENPGEPQHEEGYVFANLDLRGNGSGSGVFLYNDIDDVEVCGSSFDKLGIGVHIEGSNPGSGDTRQARAVIKGSRFTNNAGFGFLGSCDECVIEDSYFENNGTRAIYDHNIYLSGAGGAEGPVEKMRVSRNELYRSAFVDGACQGVSLVVHGTHNNLLIDDNYIHEDLGKSSGFCWGIAVDTGYGGGEAFRNVTIRGNRVENVGGVFIGLNACEGCVVENNVLINMQNQDAQGIAAPDRERTNSDLAMGAVAVRNNSIYFGKGSGTAIALGSEGTKHVVTSNAILYAGGGAFDCFDLDLPTSSYTMVDRNLCYASSGSATWVSGVGSLATWTAQSGFDKNSAQKDPGFRSLVAPYNLSSASASGPMVGQGDATLSSPIGFGGQTRVGAPDVGAYDQ